MDGSEYLSCSKNDYNSQLGVNSDFKSVNFSYYLYTIVSLFRSCKSNETFDPDSKQCYRDCSKDGGINKIGLPNGGCIDCSSAKDPMAALKQNPTTQNPITLIQIPSPIQIILILVEMVAAEIQAVVEMVAAPKIIQILAVVQAIILSQIQILAVVQAAVEMAIIKTAKLNLIKAILMMAILIGSAADFITALQSISTIIFQNLMVFVKELINLSKMFRGKVLKP